ncbi:hypothetical protein F5Y17DRAFT_232197 [Xylariaceae sp. FL0594]|nr:hypothetical protein F5Y17DRAFT_232197 [Xylariaceae sp. FL0594]
MDSSPSRSSSRKKEDEEKRTPPEPAKDRKYFPWGCSMPSNPETGFPTSKKISHMETCACPGTGDERAVRIAILEAAHRLHQSNVVKYRLPVANAKAQEVATSIGVCLASRVEDLPFYKDKVYWSNGVCMEVLGRGFTPKEFEHLRKLDKTDTHCEWVI